MNPSIKMEVGIEDCLHIEFEYNKSKYAVARDVRATLPLPLALLENCYVGRYHLKDVVTGKIYFLLVRIRIKHMELAIIRRESAGTGPLVFRMPRGLSSGAHGCRAAPVHVHSRTHTLPISLSLLFFLTWVCLESLVSLFSLVSLLCGFVHRRSVQRVP